jgi:hypothetical protein
MNAPPGTQSTPRRPADGDRGIPSRGRFAGAVRVVAGFLAVAAAMALLRRNGLREPLHWDAMGGVASASLDMLDHGFRLIHPYDTAHPPLFFAALALTWKLFGTSMLAAHLFSLACAAAGVLLTYELGAWLHGRAVGVAAATLLAFNQIYFAQSTLPTPPLALAPLGVATVLYHLQGRRLAFIVAATAMLMVHEAAAVLLAAIGVHYLYVSIGRRPLRSVVIGAWYLAVPLLPLVAWLVYHRSMTGIALRLDLLYNRSNFLYTLGLDLLRHFVYDPTSDGVNRFNFILTAAIVLAALRGGAGWDRARGESMLLALIVLFHLLLFSYTDDLPRYFLAILPFYCLLAARALDRLVQSLRYRRAALFAVVGGFCALGATNYHGRRSAQGWQLESNLEYADLVATHQKAAAYLEQHLPGATIVTVWPMSGELREPRLGYVRAPLRVQSPSETPPRGAIIYASPEAPEDPALARLVLQSRLIIEWEQDNKRAALYQFE